MDTNWLEDFVCFARLLSFTKAAEERNVTQSAFSRRIQSLELWVAVDLIDRKTYPARLTPAGEDFLPVAKAVLTQLWRTRDDLRAKTTKGRDPISFAAPHSVSIHNLTPMLQQFEDSIPDLQTRVWSDDLHTCCDYLSEGLCQFLMCYRHNKVPLALDEQRFLRLDLGTERLIPVCIPNAKGKPRWSLDQDADPISYLAYTPGSFLGAVVENLLSVQKRALEPRHTDAFAEAIKSLTICGGGLSWLPETSIRRDLDEGKLVIAGGQNWMATLTLTVFATKENGTRQSKEIWQKFEEYAARKGD